MPHKTFLALSSAAALLAATVHAEDHLEQRIGRVETGLFPSAVLAADLGRPASISNRMAFHGIPAMSIAVIENGQVQWARAYGVSERGGNRGVTPDTLFQAASVSKPVSAFGALLLVQEGALDLDKDVDLELRSWHVPPSPLLAESKITLRRLLNHTSGLDTEGFDGYEPGAPLPSLLQILNGETVAHNAAVRIQTTPGTVFHYSGGGFMVVQQLITDVTGRSFSQYMQEAVLAKLGMTNSTFEQPLSPHRSIVTAAGHRRDGSTLPGNWKVYPELAAAGLWTTPTDLARLAIELQDALAGRPTRLLKRELAREMLTDPTGNAGLGVFLAGGNGAARRFTHSGRNAGFDARLEAFKNGRHGAVVMINRNNNGGFIDEVLDSVAREYHWVGYPTNEPQRTYLALPLEIMQAYPGKYEAANKPVLLIEMVDGHLFAKPGDDPWLPLFPKSETEFFSTKAKITLTFLKDTSGAGRRLIERLNSETIQRTRAR
jgi:CubicO group peptidase (beta-lactamase class C family)